MRSFIQRYKKKCEENNVQPLPTILEINENADELDLGEVTLGSKNAICLSFAIEKCDLFRSINLSESYMGDQGASYFCKSIMNKKRLEEVNLSGANINANGSVSIGQLLKTNRSIKILSLEWNTLGTLDSGLKQISGGIKSNTVLETIDLRNNRINAEGCLKLSQALRYNTSLKKIDLRWNSVGTIGAEYIRQVLEKDNTTITSIQLSGNEVDFETQESLRRLLERNRTFEEKKNSTSLRRRKLIGEDDGEEESEEEVILSDSNNTGLESENINEDENSQMNIHIAESMKEITQMKESLRLGTFELNELKGKLHEKELEASGVRQETKTLKSTLEHLKLMHEQEIRKLDDEINHEKMMRSETSNLLEKKTKELAEITIRHDEFKTENERLTTTERVLRDRAEKAETGLRETRTRLDGCEKELGRTRRDLEVCKEEIVGLRGEGERARELDETVREKRTEIERLHEEQDRHLRSLERSKKMEISDLKKLYEDKIRDLEDQKRKTENQFEETRIMMEEWKARTSRVDGELEKARSEFKRDIEDMRIKKSSSENDCASLRLEIKQLKFKVTQQQIQARQTQKKYEREMYKLNEKLEEIVDVQDKEKQLNELRILEKIKENENLEKEIKRVSHLLTSMRENYRDLHLKMESDILKHVKNVFTSKL